MRKLKAGGFMTLDGVFQDPGGFGELDGGGWALPYFSDAARDDAIAGIEASDLFLCGRVTYELLSTAWSGNEGEYADRLREIPKLVASRTLRGPLTWNASVLDGDVPEAVAELKVLPGKDIVMYGSGTLLRTLLRHGLVDEVAVGVHPLVLGEGKRLFDGIGRADLTLVDVAKGDTGVATLIYRP
ncbi:dihydrofolate reductase [Herbihabitans rhizosphaerae]|uniref:Dihydrofolate reductase n=1 Tax=Herbihabitans rhizosphaerae TaxID=1872711 RepID=A0A4V2EUM7_9PSEU|nr:dihydrofolate reductase family protein [Herbihabitans rhizosphaerae]RZS45113.1 dihydrofolate reductase [Herbihabitans rhizosphaerae]